MAADPSVLHQLRGTGSPVSSRGVSELSLLLLTSEQKDRIKILRADAAFAE